MEYFQHIQNRAGQTVAVINQYVPTMTVGTTKTADLLALSSGLETTAQTRDDAIAAFDDASNLEHLGFLEIRGLTLSLPQAAEGELDDDVPGDAAMADLFAPAYGIVPRTTELALKRGHKVVSALNNTNAYLASLTPERGPITSGGKGVADLVAAMAAQPPLEQALDNTSAAATAARTTLRTDAAAVDRLNKRFYKKLVSEARSNPDLKAALGQIDTGANQPGTLGIASVLQGGADQLHVLVAYENGSFTPGATSTVEWMVAGVDADFKSHSLTAAPGGSSLGPFAVGQTVKLRPRVVTGTGTTTGSIRTLTLHAPPV